MTVTRRIASIAALTLVGVAACTRPLSPRDQGALVDDQLQSRDEASRRQEDILVQQREEIARNEELLHELRRRNLDARQTSRGVVVNLPDVLFEFGRADLTRDARRKVRDIAEVLRRDARDRRISIEGHTDSIGRETSNQRLSEARAASVADALVSEGVNRRRLRTRGFGETRPIAANTVRGRDNPQGRARNRRVEVVIENRRGERPAAPPRYDDGRGEDRPRDDRRDRFDDRYYDDDRYDDDHGPYDRYDDPYR